MIKVLFSINPNKALYSHFLFWLPILLFVTPALILSYPTWCLCWPSPQSYDAILKAQGLPIFVASLAIPFTVAINRFHSSAQRAESNRLTQQNMSFNHYFDHRNHFFKHTETMQLSEPFSYFVEVVNPSLLYNVIFPLNRLDKLDMSAPKSTIEEVIGEKVEVVHDHINKRILKFEKGKEPFERAENDTIEAFINRIGEPFGIAFSEDVFRLVNRQGEHYEGNVLDLCSYGISEVIDKAGQFSHLNYSRWVPMVAMDPLLKSSINSKEYSRFASYIESVYEQNKPSELSQSMAMMEGKF